MRKRRPRAFTLSAPVVAMLHGLVRSSGPWWFLLVAAAPASASAPPGDRFATLLDIDPDYVDVCEVDSAPKFSLSLPDAAAPQTLQLYRCYDDIGALNQHGGTNRGPSVISDLDGEAGGAADHGDEQENAQDVKLDSCCTLPSLYEMSMWIDHSVDHEREMLKKPLPQINTKGHMCERAIRNSFDVLLHAGDEFRKLIREALPLMAELTREFTCRRCVPGYARSGVGRSNTEQALKMYFGLVNSMESGLLNLGKQLYGPDEMQVPSTDGDFLCPAYLKPVSGLLQKVWLVEELRKRAERVKHTGGSGTRENPSAGEGAAALAQEQVEEVPGQQTIMDADSLAELVDSIRPYHQGHDALVKLHAPFSFPEGLQQMVEGWVTALSYPYSVVTQEVFLRNLGWEKMLRGHIDEEDRMWGNVVHEKSKIFGHWNTSEAARSNSIAAGGGAGGGTETESEASLYFDEGTTEPIDVGVASAVRDQHEGLLVLISNRTSDADVDRLAGELFQERRPTLVVEEVVGDGMEALGRDCHGTAESRFCLRPMHASSLKSLLRDKANVEVVWKRHANTFHLVDADAAGFDDAALVAGSKKSSGRSINSQLVTDARRSVSQRFVLSRFADDPREGLQPESVRGHEGVVATPVVISYFKHKMGRKLSETVARLQSVRVVDLRSPDLSAIAADLSISADEETNGSTPSSELTLWSDRTLSRAAVKSTSFCRHNLPLPTYENLQEYADWHAATANDPGVKKLIVVCLPFSQCGGHGDRINGLLTLFLLAFVTRRRFLILSSNPTDWHSVFVPNKIDWRTEVGQVSLTNVRTYFDKRYTFREDLDRILSSEADALLLRVNNRIVKSLYGEACDLRAPWLVSRVMQYLFSPNIYLEQTIKDTAEELGLVVGSGATVLAAAADTDTNTVTDRDQLQHGGSGGSTTAATSYDLAPYISIHYRTGDIAFDPHRHNSSLATFVSCALQIERDLGLPAETPWVLHADSLRQVPESWYLDAAGGDKYADFLNEQEAEKQQHEIDSRAEESGGALFGDDDVEGGREGKISGTEKGRLLPRPTGGRARALAPATATPSPSEEPHAFLRRKLRVPRGLGRVHIDRSDFQAGVKGFQNAFAEWYLVSQARAVLLSRSFFAETAAEIGRIRDAYFITGCVKMDLSSS